ncbi:MAG: DUF2335 domain-containing protein [Pseudomonadota bacterium]|nr:DUF2335 domain-containing protein [Pseudomonadota bacterium]
MNGQSESVESSGDLNQEQALASLVENLESGSLTKTKQVQLAELLKNAPPSLVMTATHHQSFSGPIPPPEQLSNYPDDARQVILAMAQNEQNHSHAMNEKALNGAISKDRLGQYIGGSIAIVGLVAAAWIAQYSAVAAGIIATLDLFGMVALFVAPRLLENRQNDIE